MHNWSTITHANIKDNIVHDNQLILLVISSEFVPRISSRQQSSLIGDVESAPPTVSALHAVTMEKASLSSKNYLLMRLYRIKKFIRFSNNSCYTELRCREIQWELTFPRRVLIQDTFRANGWDSVVWVRWKFEVDEWGREEKGLSHKYLRAIRCLLVHYCVYMVCHI